jgi:hypothetical protein
MRSNKNNNTNLFTSADNDNFSRHIKTHSKQALVTIKRGKYRHELLKPIEKGILKVKCNNSLACKIDLIYW